MSESQILIKKIPIEKEWPNVPLIEHVRSNIGHQPVMRPNISGAAPNRRWQYLPRQPPAPLQRTPPRPGQTANAIFKMIQSGTFDRSWRKIVPRRSDSVGEKVSTRCMTSFTSKNT